VSLGIAELSESMSDTPDADAKLLIKRFTIQGKRSQIASTPGDRLMLQTT